MLVSHPDRMIAGKDGAIGWITLNNPARHNAVSRGMREALRDSVNDFDPDESIRVIVIKGAADKAFRSGADSSGFAEKRSSPETTRAYNATSHKANKALQHAAKPPITLVCGDCIGGEVALALSCDIRSAADAASFGVPAARLGPG